MKEVYVISGLGADERVFQNLDLSGCHLTFIKWISPLKDEELEDYCIRLREQIKSESPVLIGLSFGGMIAIEIAKQIKTQKIILISSAKSRQEIPFYYRIGGKLGLDKLLPERLIRSGNIFTFWFLGLKKIEDRKIMRRMLQDTDIRLLRWSIRKIITWANLTKIENLKHIHGNADRIIPIRFVKADKVVTGGGHLMVLDKAEELTDLILVEINN